ncbi:hypothetical protein PG993_013519 [Apiospora rasikravindrae]|uniref:Uncharacterized protein n=1 Tax=Apiospora rasikravindrae TaxID=990691 RepID=A0ABR1RXV0_9PEZI
MPPKNEGLARKLEELDMADREVTTVRNVKWLLREQSHKTCTKCQAIVKEALEENKAFVDWVKQTKIQSTAASGDLEEALQSIQTNFQTLSDNIEKCETNAQGHTGTGTSTEKGPRTLAAPASSALGSISEHARRDHRLAAAPPPSAQVPLPAAKRQRINDVGGPS